MSIVADRTGKLVLGNKLLVGNQLSFRKSVATEDTILKRTNAILCGLNNKIMAGSIFCDLEKAFDYVNRDILLSKLPYYGISGKAKLLLESSEHISKTSNHYLVY